ncbi:MAG TPA: HepT-like ribonuclease domain-containing protein [Thermoanaerobaculia bacterium]|nr:HepT-like ribonuclease domain-containing protein [Thermoanaerobaculia bacterium]
MTIFNLPDAPDPGRRRSRGTSQRETCLLHPEVDWPNIVSLRNRIVHDYSGLAIGRIWDVATINVPQLITALEAFMPSDPP